MNTEDWAKKIFYFFIKERADISLKKITKDLGIPLRNLYKEWHFKTPPKKFLLSLRLASSLNLLSDNHRKIRDIAEELKFCDPIYFCRWFKKLTGITPKKFQLKYGESFSKGKLNKIKLKNININLIYWLSRILNECNCKKIKAKILENCDCNRKINFSFLDYYFWG